MAPDDPTLTTEEAANYLYQSIADLQGTIRATDVKVGFLLVIIFSPLVAFDKVEPYLRIIFQEGLAQRCLLSAAILFWGLSLVAQFAALFAISSPAKRVRGGNPVGTFYSEDLFDLGLVDVMINRARNSKRTIEEELVRLPKARESLIKELVFEKMKLAYIRSVKLKRLNWAVILMGIGMISFAVSYAVHIAGA
ncbi:MAG: hypothetical protein KGJ81_15320 [Alphaproteobacteria bacterium]|nr:hypothetical protein [Alphaproteobacteria bacterium]